MPHRLAGVLLAKSSNFLYPCPNFTNPFLRRCNADRGGFLLFDLVRHLLVVLVSLVVDDVEELELVDTPRGGDDAEPVTELLLLEELLGPGRCQWAVLYG